MHLARFPRIKLCHAPTPLEPMSRLGKLLGGPRIYIKRDDCTGLAGGGNKTRKLEFLMAEALANGADTVISQGAVQSNHVRQTAAAAAKLGLKCHGLLERRVGDVPASYDGTANVQFDRLLGAEMTFYPPGTDMSAAMDEVASRARAKGGVPYIIPGGGSCPTGALGYVACALELIAQANDMNLKIDCVVHATGSASTQAGLVAGMHGCNSGVPVLGISVRLPKAQQEENVHRLASATAQRVGMRGEIPRAMVQVNSDYVGPGYGVPTRSTIEAIKLTATYEGILLDPVYTGKGMAGLIGSIRAGYFQPDQNVVFIHTGGAQALPAYEAVLTQDARAA